MTAVPVSLNISDYNISAYNSFSSLVKSKRIEYIDAYLEFLKDIEDGKDVYVEYRNSAGRDGSIAKVYEVENPSRILSGSIALKDVTSSIYSFQRNIKFKVKFDDRKNRILATPYNSVWLQGYSGPTVWNYTKPIPKSTYKKKALLDRFGCELKEGDFVCFAYSITKRKAMTAYGHISKISATNTCYVKNIKLNDKESVREYQILDNSSLILMTEDLMDKIMIARLSS